MKLLIRCGIQQERISECMDWVKTHAGRNPARALSSAFFFGRSKRQGALANAAHRANPRQVTDCMVQFLKVGDWLQRQVRGLLKDSMSFPSGAETPSCLYVVGLGGGCLLKFNYF